MNKFPNIPSFLLLTITSLVLSHPFIHYLFILSFSKNVLNVYEVPGIAVSNDSAVYKPKSLPSLRIYVLVRKGRE